MSNMNQVFEDIREERQKQDARWGGAAHDDKHDADNWCDYIQRQIVKWEDEEQSDREMFVKIAALAVAAVESIDRLEQSR